MYVSLKQSKQSLNRRCKTETETKLAMLFHKDVLLCCRQRELLRANRLAVWTQVHLRCRWRWSRRGGCGQTGKC